MPIRNAKQFVYNNTKHDTDNKKYVENMFKYQKMLIVASISEEGTRDMLNKNAIRKTKIIFHLIYRCVGLSRYSWV